MNREQMLKLIEHVQATRALALAPIRRGTRDRPSRLTLVFFDGTVQELDFETGWEAELGLTVLVEAFPDQIDLECSGVECVWYMRQKAQVQPA
jgi:hypothetical protein